MHVTIGSEASFRIADTTPVIFNKRVAPSRGMSHKLEGRVPALSRNNVTSNQIKK
jgi:hypothetical protein